MMKKTMLLLIILLTASLVFAQKSPTGQGSTVLNGGIVEDWSNIAPGAGPNNLGGPGLGRHDLRNGTTGGALGCETCHLPHTAPTYGATFLWAWSNMPTSVTTYITETNPAATLGAPLARTNAATRSLLCLTCHDSTSANANGITGGVVLSGSPFPLMTSVGGVGSLSTQHPVNAVVPVGIDYQIVNVAAGPLSSSGNIGVDALPLWGATPTVQCTTCHDQHNDYQADAGSAGGVPFLRVANTNGTYLCRECHNQ